MIDALYRNSKVLVRLKESIKRIDGNTLEGTVKLPRRAAERLVRIDAAEMPMRDPIKEANALIRDDAIIKLNKKVPDFLYVELIRSNNEKARTLLGTLLRIRIPKIAQAAAIKAIEEVFGGKEKSKVRALNEEESVLYYLISDVIKRWLKELVEAAVAFKELGLRGAF